MASGDSKFKKMVAIGEIVLGAGFILRGIANVTGAGDGLLGRGFPRGNAYGRDHVGDSNEVIPLPPGSAVKKAHLTTVKNIDQRIDAIRTLIVKDSINPTVREEALGILTKKCGDKWCVAEKSYFAEISALFWAARDPKSPFALRYTRDHPFVDTFSSANVMRRTKGEDCDGGTTRLGAWLMAVGYPVRMRIVSQRGSNVWSHIYLLAGIPPTNPTRWVPLDWSVTNAVPGWEAPGARDAAKSGKPAGMIEKVKDYEITEKDFEKLIGLKHEKAKQEE